MLMPMPHEKITVEEFANILIESKHILRRMTRAEIDELLDILLQTKRAGPPME
jgi:hypothetical protein